MGWSREGEGSTSRQKSAGVLPQGRNEKQKDATGLAKRVRNANLRERGRGQVPRARPPSSLLHRLRSCVVRRLELGSLHHLTYGLMIDQQLYIDRTSPSVEETTTR